MGSSDRECTLSHCDITPCSDAYCEGCVREDRDTIRSLERKIERLEEKLKCGKIDWDLIICLTSQIWADMNGLGINEDEGVL